MSLLDKKEVDVTSPTDTTSANPLRDLLLIITLIASWPFTFFFKALRGRRRPLGLVMLVGGLIWGYYHFHVNDTPQARREAKTKMLQQTLEELTEEDKKELREKISTLRESVGEQTVPAPLVPLLDVQLDMLSINYLYFAIQSGYIHANGEGAEFILDSYLYSNHQLLKQAAWQSLANIKSENATRIMGNYAAEVKRKELAAKEKEKLEANKEPEQQAAEEVPHKKKLEPRRKGFGKAYNHGVVDSFGDTIRNLAR